MATNYDSVSISNFSASIHDVTAGAGDKLNLIKSALAADVAKVASATVADGTVNVTLTSGSHITTHTDASALGSGGVDALVFDPASVHSSPLILNLNSTQAAELNLILFKQGSTDDVSLSVNSGDFRGSVILSGGDDTVTLNSTRGVVVDGGDGNDSISTGTGRDTVVVGAGSDTVFTSAGNDTIIFPASWKEPTVHASVDGGLGTDTLNISALTGHVGDIASVAQVGGVVTVTFGDGSVIDAKNIEAVLYADNTGAVKLVGVSTFVQSHEPPVV